MAVARITQFRPHLDKYDKCLARVADYKKLVEKHGARVRVWVAQDSALPGTAAFVSEVDDWPRFGEITAKIFADPQYQRLQALDRSDPVADILQVSTMTELPLP